MKTLLLFIALVLWMSAYAQQPKDWKHFKDYSGYDYWLSKDGSKWIPVLDSSMTEFILDSLGNQLYQKISLQYNGEEAVYDTIMAADNGKLYTGILYIKAEGQKKSVSKKHKRRK